MPLKNQDNVSECLEESENKMAGATGLEPATSGVTGQRSNQLSYAPANCEGGKLRQATRIVNGFEQKK